MSLLLAREPLPLDADHDGQLNSIAIVAEDRITQLM